MARFLQDILKAKDPLFSFAMRKLESAAGREGIDVRLIADIITRAHQVMRRMGLDPADTTAAELYGALASHADDTELFADTIFVGLDFDGQVISFNIGDIQANASRSFADRTTDQLQCMLQHELVRRYSEHERTDDRMVEQFARDAGLNVCYSIVKHKHKQTEEIDTVKTPYILSIGDIVTDAFIKLSDDHARIDTDTDGSKRLSMDFGSKPPYDYVDIVQAVGPAPNAAVSFAHLGLNSGLTAFLGDDRPGEESLAYLQEQNVAVDTMSVQEGLKSNYWYVLRYGAERTILVKNEPYEYTWQEPTQVPDWIYLTALDENSWDLHMRTLDYVKQHENTKLVFQPGTFHFNWGKDKLADIYRHTYLLCLNKEEAALVAEVESTDVKVLAAALHELGPKVVVITDGPHGSYASDGTKVVTVPNYPDPAPPYDRTGAGDAFASTVVAALALGESLETAMSWAPINSAFVCQKIGAQAGLLNLDEIKAYLQDAPNDYVVTELN